MEDILTLNGLTIEPGLSNFRHTISKYVADARSRYIGSEGATANGIVATNDAVFVVDVLTRVRSVANTLQPNSVQSGTTTVSTWSDYLAALQLINQAHDIVRSECINGWLTPLTTLFMIRAPTTVDTRLYLTKLLNFQDTADLAQTALSFLDRYRTLVLPNMITSIGGSDSMNSAPEPGPPAITSSVVNGFQTLINSNSTSNRFEKYADMFLELLHRLHPSNQIVSGNTVFIERNTREELADLYYNTIWTSSLVAPTADAYHTTINHLVFNLAGLSTAPIVLTRTVTGRSNLPIAPGLDYFLIGQVSYAVRGGAVGAVTVTITVTSGVNTGSIVQALNNSIAVKQIDDFPLAVSGGNNPFLEMTYTISASAPLPAGVTLEIDIKDSLSVAYPFDNPLASGTIVSHPAPFIYNTVAPGDTWGQYYGTQLFFNSLTDKDHSLVGYIDNSVPDEVSIIGIIGILKFLSDNEITEMKVVDDDDVRFQANYRGSLGFKQLLVDMTDKGMSALLWNQGLMNATGGGLPVGLAAQNSIFTRLLYIVQATISRYMYGDPQIVNAVNKVLSPTII